MLTTTILKNTKLYRAAKTCEEVPTCRVSKINNKTGVYFAVDDPVLSELMSIVKYKDLIVSEYIVTEDITVLGTACISQMDLTNKYGKNFINCARSGNLIGSKYYKEFNQSHFEKGAWPTCLYNAQKWKSHIHGELFLTEQDISKIKYVGNYNISLSDAVHKYVSLVDDYNEVYKYI